MFARFSSSSSRRLMRTRVTKRAENFFFFHFFFKGKKLKRVISVHLVQFSSVQLGLALVKEEQLSKGTTRMLERLSEWTNQSAV